MGEGEKQNFPPPLTEPVYKAMFQLLISQDECDEELPSEEQYGIYSQ